MASIALIFGSIFGFFGAMTSWVVFDTTFAMTAAVYMAVSLGLAAVAIGAKMVAGSADTASPSFA